MLSSLSSLFKTRNCLRYSCPIPALSIALVGLLNISLDSISISFNIIDLLLLLIRVRVRDSRSL